MVVGETLETTSVTASIDVSSLDTGNADRDAHVLSPDILDVAARPTLDFRSTAVRGADSEWEVDGELTIGTVTHPVTLAVELGGIEAFPGDGRRHAGSEGTATVRRKDFGIDIALPPGVSAAMLGDAIKVELDLQLIEPETA